MGVCPDPCSVCGSVGGRMGETMTKVEEWGWCGYPGHFVAAQSCRFRMTTQVGLYRVSTVGAYYRMGQTEPTPLGAGPELYETMVFRAAGPVEECGVCRRVEGWDEVYMVRYLSSAIAVSGHMNACRMAASGFIGEADA